MPIYETPKGNGAQIRVAVSVDGKLRQKYFNPKTPEFLVKDRKRAKELNALWKFEANVAALNRKKQRKETRKSSAYVTGVSGIKMKFVVDTKNRPVKGAKTKRKRKIKYYTPSFVVSGSHKNKAFCKAFNIKARGFDNAWKDAVDYLCTIKEIYGKNDLIEKKPPVEQFAIIYKWQTQQGHEIPRERLPEEFLERDIDGTLSSYIDA